MNLMQQLQQAFGASEGRALYRLVMEERFAMSQTDLLLGKDTELSADDRAEVENIVGRLLGGEPVQYVLGVAEFCGRRFRVAPGVLIPRPETAELVALVAERQAKGDRILDIGTGSGCIAISLALNGFDLTAYDISREALAIAKENASTLHAQVDFRQMDILHEATWPADGHWQAIVSNPPYICRREAADMATNVLDHEPHQALFVPDDDPLLFYRAITQFAVQRLEEGGGLYFECNRAFARDVAQLMETTGFRRVVVHRDQFDNERFVSGAL